MFDGQFVVWIAVFIFLWIINRRLKRLEGSDKRLRSYFRAICEHIKELRHPQHVHVYSAKIIRQLVKEGRIRDDQGFVYLKEIDQTRTFLIDADEILNSGNGNLLDYTPLSTMADAGVPESIAPGHGKSQIPSVPKSPAPPFRESIVDILQDQDRDPNYLTESEYPPTEVKE